MKTSVLNENKKIDNKVVYKQKKLMCDEKSVRFFIS